MIKSPMQIIKYSLLVLLLLSTSLHADDDDGKGFYVGLGFGETAYVDSGFAKEQLASSKVTDDIASNTNSAKLYGGYQVNNIVGVELAYTYYGTYEINDAYTYKAQAISAAANLGYSFLRGQLRPYGLLGLGYVYTDFPHPNVDVGERGGSLLIGLGLDYTPKQFAGIGFRLAFESNNYAYTIDRNEATEKKYQQGLGMLYFGVDYSF